MEAKINNVCFRLFLFFCMFSLNFYNIFIFWLISFLTQKMEKCISNPTSRKMLSKFNTNLIFS